jgi:hypothetical protein
MKQQSAKAHYSQVAAAVRKVDLPILTLNLTLAGLPGPLHGR